MKTINEKIKPVELDVKTFERKSKNQTWKEIALKVGLMSIPIFGDPLIYKIGKQQNKSLKENLEIYAIKYGTWGLLAYEIFR